MAKELLRLKQSLVNRPLLATLELTDFAFDYINDRSLSTLSDIKLEDEMSDRGGYTHRVAFNKDTRSAVINLEGAMTYKSTFLQALCGGVSYQGLISDFASLVNDGAKTVVLMVNSGGGEAYQCFPTANEIRNIANEYGVRILAAIDGISASAAYAITSIADEVVMLEGSEVGSIGVVVRLMNDSKALDKEGIERSFITAGEDKVPYAKDGSFTEGFIQSIQDSVDETYEKFVNHVAHHRGISVDVVKSTQANMYTEQKAIELGLADKVMTLYEFMDYSADYIQTNNIGAEMPLSKFMTKEKEEDMKLSQANEQLTAQNETLAQELLEAKEAQALMGKDLQDALAIVQDLQTQVGVAQAQAEAVKQEARKSELSKVLAEDKVEDTFLSLQGLSDEAFTQVLSTFAVTTKQAQESDMFKALGTSTHANEPQAELEQEDLTLKMLKERYA